MTDCDPYQTRWPYRVFGNELIELSLSPGRLDQISLADQTLPAFAVHQFFKAQCPPQSFAVQACQLSGAGNEKVSFVVVNAALSFAALNWGAHAASCVEPFGKERKEIFNTLRGAVQSEFESQAVEFDVTEPGGRIMKGGRFAFVSAKLQKKEASVRLKRREANAKASLMFAASKLRRTRVNSKRRSAAPLNNLNLQTGNRPGCHQRSKILR